LEKEDIEDAMIFAMDHAEAAEEVQSSSINPSINFLRFPSLHLLISEIG